MTEITGRRDGGYNAIKGFIFQFDASLLRIYDEPSREFQIEGEQDLSVEDSYIQVKHRSQKFSHAAISDAIRQMIHQFSVDREKRFLLYCYFQDRAPGSELTLDISELKKILRKDTQEFSEELITEFSKCLTIQFSVDYKEQFNKVVTLLMKEHCLQTEVEAIACHAVIQKYLFDLVVNNPPGARLVSGERLREVVNSTRTSIFHSGYQNFFGNERYIKLLRSEVTQRGINLPKRERLFVVECPPQLNAHDVVDIALAVRKRFYRRHNSFSPYLVLRGMEDLSIAKRLLIDAEVGIFDGTYFNGDRLRLGDLTNPKIGRSVELKISGEENIPGMVEMVSFADVYDFFISSPSQLIPDSADARVYRRFVQCPQHVSRVLR
ncbi:hypothetical protein OG266_29330 [Streptomyces sp. NBC_00554]|uniref:hypothetical protein n=1 Tax=Streptomyces sp. NBC_00554 TaxID=2903661 RepID=UPI00352CC8F8|nr:hypothetical protein OG266_29330 [Streptomyces sp. NBC_00554]